MSCDADIKANELLTSLTNGVSFNLPEVDLSGAEFQFPGTIASDLYQEVTRLTNDDITTGDTAGSGTFDALMRGYKAHLREEYDAGRITGDQYTKAYIELTAAAMNSSVSFLLGREQAFWQGVTGQMSAIAARAQIEVEKAKVITARLEANTVQANYAITKIKLASEDVAYCIANFQLDNMLPMQLNLLTEQAEAARAQTMDTRLDGTTLVAGSVGMQKDLHAQQIVSYERDIEIKVAKVFSDAWTIQKTMDEGLLAPNNFTNTTIDAVITKLKTNAGLN